MKRRCARAAAVTRDDRGTHIEIPAGLVLDEPLVVDYDVADAALVAHTFVTAGDGARAGDRRAPQQWIADREIAVSTTVTAGANADINYTVLENRRQRGAR